MRRQSWTSAALQLWHKILSETKQGVQSCVWEMHFQSMW